MSIGTEVEDYKVNGVFGADFAETAKIGRIAVNINSCSTAFLMRKEPLSE